MDIYAEGGRVVMRMTADEAGELLKRTVRAVPEAAASLRMAIEKAMTELPGDSPEGIVVARPGNVHCPHCGGRLGEVSLDPKLWDSASSAQKVRDFEVAAAERAHIRKELLAELNRSYESLFTGTSLDATLVQAVPVSDLIAFLNQICPEEE